MDKAWAIKDILTEICRKSGFAFVTIDLKGYRTGSMNEALAESVKLDFSKNDARYLNISIDYAM